MQMCRSSNEMSVGQVHHFDGFGWFRSGVLLIGMWNVNVHSKIDLSR